MHLAPPRLQVVGEGRRRLRLLASARFVKLLPQLPGGLGRRFVCPRATYLPVEHEPGDPEAAGQPRESAPHLADATLARSSCLASRRLVPERRPPVRPPKTEGRSHPERDRLRDIADARPRGARGAPGRDPRAHPRADRARRRKLGFARAVGPAQARLRDRPQGRGRVPPADVQGRPADPR